MKRLLLSVALLLSASASTAMAKDTTLARHISREIPNHYAVIELTDAQELNINLYKIMTRFSPHLPEGGLVNSPVETVTKNLNSKVYIRLLRQVINLSNAPLKETHQDFVCMMVPPVGPSESLQVLRGYSHESLSFEGQLELIVDGKGCWSHSHVNPSAQHDVVAAQKLIHELEVLALDALETVKED